MEGPRPDRGFPPPPAGGANGHGGRPARDRRADQQGNRRRPAIRREQPLARPRNRRNSCLLWRMKAAVMREITYMKATLEGLSEEMAKNPKIFVMGEGIGQRGGNFNTTTGLFDLYGPERLCDTPICERGFVGLSCGAAMTGTHPVIDFMFSDFILDAVGELINQIAKIQYMSSGRL